MSHVIFGSYGLFYLGRSDNMEAVLGPDSIKSGAGRVTQNFNP